MLCDTGAGASPTPPLLYPLPLSVALLTGGNTGTLHGMFLLTVPTTAMAFILGIGN